MGRKPRPTMLYPIGIRGNDTGEAIAATCKSTASRLLAKYQTKWGSNFYLMNPVTLEGNRHKFNIVAGEVPPESASATPRQSSWSSAEDRHAKMMQRQFPND